MISDKDDCLLAQKEHAIMSEGTDDKQQNGGHAFPTQTHEYDGHGAVLQYQENGMTLLDYFAGQALNGLAAKSYNSMTCMAEDAYEISQAMLVERAKINQPRARTR